MSLNNLLIFLHQNISLFINQALSDYTETAHCLLMGQECNDAENLPHILAECCFQNILEDENHRI
jgi:hypothetical protein